MLNKKRLWLAVAGCGAFLLGGGLFLNAFAQAAGDYTPSTSPKASFGLGKHSMNGYTLEQYPELLEELQTIGGKDENREWHFVTVRYRRDTGEMRWTYANKLAWETLSAGRTDYPDGAVFAKVGIMTQDDPDFSSSVMPSGAKRFQLMVYDKERHKDTDGWGYALFGNRGEVNDESDNDQSRACHACHEIVAKKNYVFSVPVSMAFKAPVMMDAFSKMEPSQLPYETRKYADLPEGARAFVPEEYKEIRILTGAMQKYVFQGTLDEIRPALAQEAVRSGMPAVLFSKDGQKFSVAFPDLEKRECSLPSGEKGINMRAVFSGAKIDGVPDRQHTLNFCQPDLLHRD